MLSPIRFEDDYLDPSSLGAALALWLSPEASFITTDGSGNVSQWADRSANAFLFQNATAAHRPAYKTGGANGFPYTQWSQSGASQLISTVAFNIVQPCEFFAVVRLDSVPPTQGAYMCDQGTGNNMAIESRAGDNELFLFDTANGPTTPLSTGVDALGHAVFNGASSTISVGGGADVIGNPGSTTPASAAFSLGSYVNGGGFSWLGRIYEFIGVSGLLTSTQRTAMKRYLGRKYSVLAI